MRAFCISCSELPDRKEAAEKHFKSHGLDVDFINGIHGETFKLVCYGTNPINRPGRGELSPISQVGLSLSHYMVWNMLLHLPGDHFMVLEDDAKFCFGWQDRLKEALEFMPTDWDILLIGNSHTADKERRRINGDVYEVKYPFCTHAYIVAKKALPVLLKECRSANLPIDVNLILNAYPLLNVYSVIPRIAGQRGLELPE